MKTADLPKTIKVDTGCIFIPDRLSYVAETLPQMQNYLSDLQYLLSSMTEDDKFFHEDQGFYIYSDRPTYLKWAHKKYLLNIYHTVDCNIIKRFAKDVPDTDELFELGEWAASNYDIEALEDGLYLIRKDPK